MLHHYQPGGESCLVRPDGEEVILKELPISRVANAVVRTTVGVGRRLGILRRLVLGLGEVVVSRNNH